MGNLESCSGRCKADGRRPDARGWGVEASTQFLNCVVPSLQNSGPPSSHIETRVRVSPGITNPRVHKADEKASQSPTIGRAPGSADRFACDHYHQYASILVLCVSRAICKVEHAGYRYLRPVIVTAGTRGLGARATAIRASGFLSSPK
jgi:hypothetical protein